MSIIVCVQGAIAAKPSSSYRGYILGGLLWFTIPFALATSLGLGSRALDLPVTPAEAASVSKFADILTIVIHSSIKWLFATQLILQLSTIFYLPCRDWSPQPLPLPSLGRLVLS